MIEINSEESTLYAEISGGELTANVAPAQEINATLGESAMLEVSTAVNYIESGRAELQPLVNAAAISADRAESAKDAAEQIVDDCVTQLEFEAALLEKQDVIRDLSEIRQGATLGATAVQPSDLESYATTQYVDDELLGKQDTLVSGTNIKTINGENITGSGNLNVTAISQWGNINGALSAQTDLWNVLEEKANVADIPTATSDLLNDSGFITNAALVGYATESYVTTALSTGLAGKQDTISDLATIRSGAALGATALQSISSSDVTTALGYTPYNASNPSGYITSAALENYVTTNTAQTIDGAKTFLQDVAAKINYTRGIAPASTVYPKPFIIYDANGKIFACMQLLFSANKLTRAELLAYNGADSSDNSPASMGVVNNNGSKYAYAPPPTEDTTVSTQIDTVGARNTKLGSYVTLAGNQEITGRKNFVGSLQNVRLKMNSDAENAYTDLAFLKNDDTRVAYIRGNSSGELGIVANKVTVPASSEANSAVNTAAISKASNGYVQLGNGVIINWGTTTVQTLSQTATVTFSKAFSNNNAAHVALQAGGSDMPKVSSLKSTSFVLSREGSGSPGAAATYTWIAIGY